MHVLLKTVHILYDRDRVDRARVAIVFRGKITLYNHL